VLRVAVQQTHAEVFVIDFACCRVHKLLLLHFDEDTRV
jgi:hypothetical protein